MRQFKSLDAFAAARGGKADQRWSPNLRQVAKVDPTMRRTIHHENAQTVHG